MINISDVVDLIIDKKIKELELINKENKLLLEKLKEESEIFIKKFYRNLIKNNFEDSLPEIDGIVDDELDEINEVFSMLSLEPKGYREIGKKIETLISDIYKIKNQIYNIKDSKLVLITEVTLQQLSAIDIDFNDKIDELVNKIFQNNSKQIN